MNFHVRFLTVFLHFCINGLLLHATIKAIQVSNNPFGFIGTYLACNAVFAVLVAYTEIAFNIRVCSKFKVHHLPLHKWNAQTFCGIILYMAVSSLILPVARLGNNAYIFQSILFVGGIAYFHLRIFLWLNFRVEGIQRPLSHTWLLALQFLRGRS